MGVRFYLGYGDVLELGRGSGMHSTGNVLNTTELFALKQFILCEFHLKIVFKKISSRTFQKLC